MILFVATEAHNIRILHEAKYLQVPLSLKKSLTQSPQKSLHIEKKYLGSEIGVYPRLEANRSFRDKP